MSVGKAAVGKLPCTYRNNLYDKTKTATAAKITPIPTIRQWHAVQQCIRMTLNRQHEFFKCQGQYKRYTS